MTNRKHLLKLVTGAVLAKLGYATDLFQANPTEPNRREMERAHRVFYRVMAGQLTDTQLNELYTSATLGNVIDMVEAMDYL
jgi:hypothetical protein